MEIARIAEVTSAVASTLTVMGFAWRAIRHFNRMEMQLESIARLARQLDRRLTRVERDRSGRE